MKNPCDITVYFSGVRIFLNFTVYPGTRQYITKALIRLHICISVDGIWDSSWQNLFMQYAVNKGTDHPAHLHNLISAFVVRFLDSIIPLVSISEISSLYLASEAVQASLCLPWSQTPKTGFLVTWLIWHEQVLFWLGTYHFIGIALC